MSILRTETDRSFSRNIVRAVSLLLTTAFAAVPLTACDFSKSNIREPYGVFLSYDGDLDKLSDYNTVVIDAQYFDAEEIAEFKEDDHTVFSYINVGSIEDFRDYYSDYEDLCLGPYENWEEEQWIDVSSSEWQTFILETIAADLAGKGIDGFFVDNCDVYYLYQTDEIFDGLCVIMRGLIDTGLKVTINGGDVFMSRYYETYGRIDDVITGINQESVFSRIDWETGTFSRATEEDFAYFSDYLERYASFGADIYLLEYTTDDDLIKDISGYCRKHGFIYYVSDSLELDF